MNHVDAELPVIIVGAGPTGTALAIDLALRNTPSILVERYQQPQQIPKGQNLTQRTGEHFRCWGITEQIRQATLIPPEYGNEGMVAFGNLLSEYHYDWFKRGTVREYYAADNERLPQFETERILRERASQFECITTYYGWTYSGYSQKDDHVAATFKPTNGSGQMEVSGSYLVGCDGARSPVRESASIELSIDESQRRMALLVFHSPELHQLLDSKFPGKTIFNALDPANEGYWQFFGRIDLDANWFFHAPVPNDVDLDEYDFQRLLHKAVGTEISFQLNYKGFWDLRFSHANTYRSGRVFIAGDAAHNHPPYGGYGVNTGFEDARNLSWKLAAQHHGWGSDNLLDSYTSERHPVFASTRDDFILRMLQSDAAFVQKFSPERDQQAFSDAWHQRATQGQREVAGFVPHYSGSPIVFADGAVTVSGAKGIHTHQPVAGSHLSPQSFENTDSLFDDAAQQYTLLTPAGGESTAKHFRQAADRFGVPLNIVAVTSQAEAEPPGGADGTIEDNRSSCVLVRPDHFIAWVENPHSSVSATEVSQVLSRCIGM